MKNIAIKGTITAVLLVALSVACKDSFLTVPPTGAVGKEQLSTKKGLEGALISVYSNLNGRANRMASASNWVWGSIRGGDANKGTDPGDFSDINPIQRFENLSTQGVINDKYTGTYEGVARANAVLQLLTTATAEVTDADKKRISAEARFLRAHYYSELK